jgi:hypothetical protein
MVSLLGVYQNGYLKLDKDYPTSAPVKVIVTFLEEVQSDATQGMALADFSFAKGKENLKTFEGSFSETVVAERRAEL